ncbi:hypothetical protein D3C85_1128610 [compost metagenome]
MRRYLKQEGTFTDTWLTSDKHDATWQDTSTKYIVKIIKASPQTYRSILRANRTDYPRSKDVPT